MRVAWFSLGLALVAASAAVAETASHLPIPAAVVADGVPPIPGGLEARAKPYLAASAISLVGWNVEGAMLVTLPKGGTAQVQAIARPLAPPTAVTSEPEPVSAYPAPIGDAMVVAKDRGGDERYQLFLLEKGVMTPLSAAGDATVFGRWRRDGRRIGFVTWSADSAELVVMDPRVPARRVSAQLAGQGWLFEDFASDGNSVVLLKSVSGTESSLWKLDLATKRLSRLTPERKRALYGGQAVTRHRGKIQVAPNGALWAVSDVGGEFRRLGVVDPVTGMFSPRTPKTDGDVQTFDISRDGGFVAYVLNDGGADRLKVLEIPSGRIRTVKGLQGGVASPVIISPQGLIGLTYSSAQSPERAYGVDPTTLRVTAWTPLPAMHGGATEPEHIVTPSFDGVRVSALVYRPDPVKFPGPRPVIVDLHGGPEWQARPAHLGSWNFYLQELGVALVFPNVRGSTGYGKTFLSLDDGPFRRENALRDVGAILDRLSRDSGLDRTRIGVSGASYGGYLCYASAIEFATRLRGASCTVGITSFTTFLANTEAYRRDLRRVEYGDDRRREERAKLELISPLRRARELKIPLLVATGANDPRVPANEAQQMVEAVRRNGGVVWHVWARNEGHNFLKQENVAYQFYATATFWQRTLQLGGIARDGDERSKP